MSTIARGRGGRRWPGAGPAAAPRRSRAGPSGVQVVAPADRSQAAATGDRSRSTSGSTTGSTPARCASGSSPGTVAPRASRDHRPARRATRPAHRADPRRRPAARPITTVEARRRLATTAPRQARPRHGTGDRDRARLTSTTARLRRAGLEHLLVGARGRSRDRGPLRHPRVGEVPHAVPERLLHRRRRRRPPTGRRVHFDPESMTANVNGVRVDPTEWNRNDGFSPGAMIVTYVPGLDLEQTGAAPITDIGASLDRDQPIVLLDTDTGERWPFFAELDAQADPPDQRALIIRPAKNLHRGPPLRRRAAQPARRGRRDDRRRAWLPALPRPHPDVHARDRGPPPAPRADLRRARTTPASSATTCSSRGTSPSRAARTSRGRMLHIRDDAFAGLGGGVPGFTVTRSRRTSTTSSSAG